jgi:hypothetical protein
MMKALLTNRLALGLLVVATVVVLGIGAVIASRNVTSDVRCETDIPVEKDVEDARAFGAAFEPESWTAEWANHPDSVSALWRDSTGLLHVDYLRYNCGLTRTHLDEYGFDISLGGYEDWERTAQCEADGLILHEFDVVYEGQDYRTRFWLQPASGTRLAALQLTFPATRMADMDTYAARLFPALSVCQ